MSDPRTGGGVVRSSVVESEIVPRCFLQFLTVRDYKNEMGDLSFNEVNFALNKSLIHDTDGVFLY